MKFKFRITPPNFVITDKGKFSLADLDSKEFNDYLYEYRMHIMIRRQQQQKYKKLKQEGTQSD